MTSSLDTERKTVREKIQRLEEEKTTIEAELSKYPPMPHDNTTREETQLINRLELVTRESARLVELYENLLLESAEVILTGLADDSKNIKWLTIWLLVLTAILSLGTIVDVLSRLGLIK